MGQYAIWESFKLNKCGTKIHAFCHNGMNVKMIRYKLLSFLKTEGIQSLSGQDILHLSTPIGNYWRQYYKMCFNSIFNIEQSKVGSLLTIDGTQSNDL